MSCPHYLVFILGILPGLVWWETFERFVRGFFADVLAGGGSRAFVDVGTGAVHSGADAVPQPELLAVLPSGKLLAAWRELHAP